MSTMRAALEASFDQHAEEAEDGEVIAKETPDVIENEGSVIDDATNLGGEQAEGDVAKLAAERPIKSKPTTSNEDKQPLLENGEQAPKVELQAPQTQQTRAPVSWKPELRAEFATLKPSVQAEIQRREVEIDRTLRQTSNERQYAGRLNQTIAPYEAMIRAEGGDHFTAVDNLLKTAYHLRTANPQKKANLVAEMIMQHGVDLNLLDASLSNSVQGKQNQQAQDPMMAYMQSQLAPVQQFVQQINSRQQQVQQEQTQNAYSEMQTFASDPKNEYFHDVREVMADFLDAAASRGQKMSLSDAYNRATLAHPSISTLVMNQRMSATAAQRNAAVKRARQATASLPSGGSTSGGAADGQPAKQKNLRSAIEAAWDQAEQVDN